MATDFLISPLILYVRVKEIVGVSSSGKVAFSMIHSTSSPYLIFSAERRTSWQSNGGNFEEGKLVQSSICQFFGNGFMKEFNPSMLQFDFFEIYELDTKR